MYGLAQGSYTYADSYVVNLDGPVAVEMVKPPDATNLASWKPTPVEIPDAFLENSLVEYSGLADEQNWAASYAQDAEWSNFQSAFGEFQGPSS